MMLGGIELGGTKTIVAVGKADGSIAARATLPTTAPEVLVEKIAGFFAEQRSAFGPISHLGVGAFGPIVIDSAAPDYGRLLETNKPGWSGFNLVGALRAALNLPITLTTDVGAAGIGEARFGALTDVHLGIYLTVGTGIGGSVLHDGKPLPALLHSEIGHIALNRIADDNAPSICRFHKNCAEGLASGPAILARFGQQLDQFAPDSTEVALIADYLGQLCSTLVFTLSPQRIVLGGGVSKTPGLLANVENAMLHQLDGYMPAMIDNKPLVTAPVTGEDAGILGGLTLALPRN